MSSSASSLSACYPPVNGHRAVVREDATPGPAFRATPTVSHPSSPSFIFWQIEKKQPPTVSHPSSPSLASSEKRLPSAHICARDTTSHRDSTRAASLLPARAGLLPFPREGLRQATVFHTRSRVVQERPRRRSTRSQVAVQGIPRRQRSTSSTEAAPRVAVWTTHPIRFCRAGRVQIGFSVAAWCFA